LPCDVMVNTTVLQRVLYVNGLISICKVVNLQPYQHYSNGSLPSCAFVNLIDVATVTDNLNKPNP